MKTTFTFAVLTLTSMVSTAAFADGLICVGQQTATTVKVYNHTDATSGVRNPSIMIVSSPFVHYPNKTIAKFTDTNGTLKFLGYGKYEAKVDLNTKDSSRGGENIAGTKLAQLSTINLDAQFAYNTPVAQGAQIKATLSYTKLNGEVLSEKADCTRYLKN